MKNHILNFTAKNNFNLDTNCRFYVEVITKDLTKQERIQCDNIIKELQSKTKIVNIRKGLFGSLKDKYDAAYLTVYFASELRKYPEYFNKIRCFDTESREEKVFISQ